MAYYTTVEDTEQLAPSQPPSFVLMPMNAAARKVVEHSFNEYYKHHTDPRNGIYGLWISFEDLPVYNLGSGEPDQAQIHIPAMRNKTGPCEVDEVHASFSLVPETGAILLTDLSVAGTTETFAPSGSHSRGPPHVVVPLPQNDESPRQIVVARGINSYVAFGRDKFFQFELQWYTPGLYAFDASEPYSLGPRKAATKRYIQGDKVGGGTYGQVYSALDLTTGTIMAVKKFSSLTGKNLSFATREITNLFRIRDSLSEHPHILQIIDSAIGKNRDWGEIYMPLMEGNLKHLVERTPGLAFDELGDTVLKQMLQALDCIAQNNIVHRDIKPENILWKYDANGDYQFCLADFGLSNDPSVARTVAGTEVFMAPEVFNRQKQSFGVDIWSLFATVVWIKNTRRFRSTCQQYGAKEIHSWLVDIAKLPEYKKMKRMASLNPKRRPTAAEQLAMLEADWEEEEGIADEGDFAEEEDVDDVGYQFEHMEIRSDEYDESVGSSGGYPFASYEPYGVLDSQGYSYDQTAGPSQYRTYNPPGHGEAPRDTDPQYPAYGYGHRTAGSDGDDTAVPSMWAPTARAMPTEEKQPAYKEPKHSKKKDKGKNRA